VLHYQNRNTDRSLWGSHYHHCNSYLISPYSFNQPDCRIEFCSGWVNPRKLQVPAFAGQARDEKFFALYWMLSQSTWTKHVDVLKLFASIALRIVRLHKFLWCNNPLLRNISSNTCHVVGKGPSPFSIGTVVLDEE